MPTANPTTSSCRKSAGRTHPSQRAAGLESEAGNQRSFSLDNWPPMFRSRTGDPRDPCYVGKSIAGIPPLPGQRPRGAEGQTDTYGVRVVRGSRTWALWALLVRRGIPMYAAEIAIHLNCRVKDVSGTASRLVKGEAVKARKISGDCEYSVGDVPVVEV